MLFNQRFDMRRDSSPVKAHHEQLALHAPALARRADSSSTRCAPWSCIRAVSEQSGMGCGSGDGAAEQCAPIEIIPVGIQLVGLRHDDGACRVGVLTRTGSVMRGGLNVTRSGLLTMEDGEEACLQR